MLDYRLRIKELIVKNLRHELSDAEWNELEVWASENQANRSFLEKLTNEKELISDLKEVHSTNIKAGWVKMQKKLKVVKKPEIYVQRKKKFLVPAFALLSVIAIFIIFMISTIHIPSNNKKISKVYNPPAFNYFNDTVLSGWNKVVLTVAHGSTYNLENIPAGHLTEQGNILITKGPGKLYYKSNANLLNDEVVYNTVSTSRGKQFQLVLSDGSHVWLNASSSIHFPNIFDGDERIVEITGEAYFEIAENRKKPFRVIIHPAGEKGIKSEVVVLGTRFNINAYFDQASIVTTLVEGKIKVKPSTSGREFILNPGHQISYSTDGSAVTDSVDTKAVLACKNGFFNFQNAPIEKIIGQISRWYDVDIKCEGFPDLHYTGQIPREYSLSDILKLLERTGNIHFKRKGNTIIVVP